MPTHRNTSCIRRQSLVKFALGVAVLAALPSVLGGCACRCTGAVREESGRALTYAMDAESARFCDAKRKMMSAPSSFADGLVRDAKTGWANLCGTVEVYGGCHESLADVSPRK